MTFDVRNDRLDATIRDALRWQADRAPELTPPLDQAMQDLARSLGGKAAARDPRRTWVLLAAAAMLVTLLVGTLAIGAGIIRLPWETEEPPTELNLTVPPFGFGGACRSELPAGLLLEVTTPGGPRLTLHEDGTLLSVHPAEAEALAFSSFSATVIERRMTARGIELLLGAITDTGLTSGCRDLFGIESVSGFDVAQFRAATSAGPIIVSVGSFPGAYGAGPSIVRMMDAEETEQITTLLAQLSDPASWLPPDAWADDGPREVVPESWEISVGWYDSGQNPGDTLVFEDKTLAGANPDFAAIRLPNGDALDGDACVVASTQETRSFADAVEQASHTQDFAWYVFSEDLTREYAITAFAVLPGEEPCAAPHFAPDGGQQQPEPSHPPEACAVVAGADLADVLGEVETTAVAPVTLLDTQTPSCILSAAVDEGGFSRRVSLAVLPRDLTLEEAGRAAVGLLGAEATQEPMGDGSLWLSGCWDHTCPPAIVAWSSGRLFMLRFDRDTINGSSFVSLEEARDLAAAIAAAIDGS